MTKKRKGQVGVGSRVIAAVDLPGVPAGTRGRVQVESGLTWLRYWIQFDNGVWAGSVPSDKVLTPEEWERQRSAPATATAAPAQDAAADGAVAEEAPAANGAGGVPEHLLERSRRARERLAAG